MYRLPRPDPEELEERPNRLKALVAASPWMTHAQLGREYAARYGKKLSSDVVARTLQRAGLYRQHPPDAHERKRRQEYFQKLVNVHPSISLRELAQHHREEFGVDLTPDQISTALRTAEKLRYQAQKRMEIDRRNTRLKKLYEKHPKLSSAALAEEYERVYGIALKPFIVKRGLKSQGIVRHRFGIPRPVDIIELAKRPERLAKLLAQHPRWTYKRLAEEYQRRYGIKLHLATVRMMLAKHHPDVYQERTRDRKEGIKERRTRLKKLHRQNPAWSSTRLAKEYKRQYKVELLATTITEDLQLMGIYRRRRLDSEEFSARPARLKALRRQYPEMTYQALANEYEKQYGIKIDSSTLRKGIIGRRANKSR